MTVLSSKAAAHTWSQISAKFGETVSIEHFFFLPEDLIGNRMKYLVLVESSKKPSNSKKSFFFVIISRFGDDFQKSTRLASTMSTWTTASPCTGRGLHFFR